MQATSPMKMIAFVLVVLGLGAGLLLVPAAWRMPAFVGVMAGAFLVAGTWRPLMALRADADARERLRWHLARLSFGAGLVLTLVCAWSFYRHEPSFIYAWTLPLYALTVFLLGAAGYLSVFASSDTKVKSFGPAFSKAGGGAGAAPPERPYSLRPFSRPLLRPFPLLLALLAVAYLMQSNVNDLGALAPLASWLRPTLGAQFALLMLAIAGLVVGLGGLRLTPRLLDAFQPRRYHLWLVLIAVIAAITRLWMLEEGLHRLIDEWHFTNAIAYYWLDDQRPFLLPFSTLPTFTWFFSYLQLLTTNVIGPSLAAIRVVAVIFGVLTVWATTALAREAFDRPTAILAGLLLATFPPHVHWSRIGIYNIADPFFGVLTFLFLLRGFKHGRPLDYALAGVSLGLTHYFYEGGRLFYPPLVALWLVWLMLTARRNAAFHAPSPANLLRFGLAAGALILPVYYALIVNDISATARLDAVGGANPVTFTLGRMENDARLFGWPRALWLQVDTPLLSYTQYADVSKYYHGQTAFVLPLLVPIFLLGLTFCFWRLRSPGGSLLFWWTLAAPVATSVLIYQTVESRVFVVVFPALALVMAVGLRETWRLARRFSAGPPRWWGRAAIGLVIAAVLYQGGYYLGDHLPNFYATAFDDERGRDGALLKDHDDVLFRAVELPQHSSVFIISPEIYGASGYWMVTAYHQRPEVTPQWVRPDELSEAWLAEVRRAYPFQHLAFFVHPDDAASINWLEAHFTLQGPTFSPHNIPRERQYALYFAPAEVNAAELTGAVWEMPGERDD